MARSEDDQRQPSLVRPAEQPVRTLDQALKHLPRDGVVLVQPVEAKPRRNQGGDDAAEGMNPLAGGTVGQSRSAVRIVDRVVQHQWAAVEIRHVEARMPVWLTNRIVEHQRGRMTFRQIQGSARLQKMHHDARPASDVGQPEIPPQVTYTRSNQDGPAMALVVVEIGFDEPRTIGEAQFGRKRSGRRDRWGREIETDDVGATLRQDQAVVAEMALQMKQPEPIDRPQLRLFYRVLSTVS